MKLHQFAALLRTFPQTITRFILPNGDPVPTHAHVTEVGHVVKNFIDCGGQTGKTESVVLQTHVSQDKHHRLRSDRLATILESADRLLPPGEFDVEVEYDCCVISQHPIIGAQPSGDDLDISLGVKHTQCLAQKRRAQQAHESCDLKECCE